MREQDLGDGRVNDMIGTALGLGFIAPKQFAWCAGIFFICIPFILKNPPQGLLLFACIYGTFWVLTGNDPTKFFERLRQPKKYIAEELILDFNKAGIPMPEKPKRQATTYQIKGKKIRYHHIERKWHLLTYGQIELDGKKVGFYLLRRGSQLMFIFGWEVNGHDPSMTAAQSWTILSACNDALSTIKDIDLKCYEDITSDCEEYLRMQAELLASKDHDVLSRELIKSRARRAKQLSEEGRLLSNRITIFAKYRVPLGGDYAITQTWLDDLLSKSQPLVGAFKGKSFESQQAWEKVIDYAYRYAYRQINSLLSSNKGGFGMRLQTMTVHDLWSRDYLELHRPPVPEVPQYIVYNHYGLQPPVINDPGTHALSTLFEAQDGISAEPQFDRHYAYLPSKGQFAAFVRIGQVRSFPKDKEIVPRGYLRYFWNILAGTNQPLYNCRVISELTPDRSGFEVHQLDRVISNSVKREALAAKKQTVDVVAMRRREQAIEARDLLEDNNIPYWCSVGIWVYRKSKDELNQAVNDLIQRIPTATVERVANTTEDVWFQSWAFEWEAFLTKPNHRRQKYIGFQALPLMPLIKTKSADKKGIMLVTRELNSSLYIDIANKKNHTAIIAKTGGGKSILMFEMILEYLLYGYLAVIFDFPRPDGSSTFTVFVPILQRLGVKAAYHNVRDSVMNIIEWPDLRYVKSKKQYEKRWQQAFQNHVRLLCAIVMGTTDNPDREVLVTSLLTQCYADFLVDETIKRRYSAAIEGSFGSDAYQNMPILETFVDYAEEWFGKYIEQKKDRISTLVNDTVDIITTQLRGVLKTSLGASINGISSFDTNVQFLVVGLTDVSENLDSLIYAMSGLNVLMRQSLSAKRSLFATDEGTILYKMPFYARETGIIPVHGRKWGCNFLVAAQEIQTILTSCSGNEIFKNLDNIFCGHVEDAAISEMLDLKFREELIRPYTSESFKPSPELLQSYWYLKRGDQHLEVTHAASELLLGLGATDPEENAARKRVMALHPGNEIAGIKHFSQLNAQAKVQGLTIDSIFSEVSINEEEDKTA